MRKLYPSVTPAPDGCIFKIALAHEYTGLAVVVVVRVVFDFVVLEILVGSLLSRLRNHGTKMNLRKTYHLSTSLVLGVSYTVVVDSHLM